MTTALQQQVFALDARYNAHRAPESPNFRTLYIRRRSQLLRETNSRSTEKWKQYLRIRSQLLQQRYGSLKVEHNSVNGSLASLGNQSNEKLATPSGSVVPTKNAEASKALVGGTTIGENYAFVGVHHIFDQHTHAVTMIKFANNDKSRLCCSSLDQTLSICDVSSTPPSVIAILRGHTSAVSGNL
nr:unnamed protein product [Callosobruchus analis]